MKKIYLVRHAKSSWKEEGLSDFERPLNKRGERDAPLMAGILKSKVENLDLIISSPAKRALTTAKIFANELNYDPRNIIEDENIYDAGIGSLMKVINNIPGNISVILLFGHNPGLTMLSNYLGDKYLDNIPTCGIVKLQINLPDWNSIADNSAKIIFFDYPKKYYND